MSYLFLSFWLVGAGRPPNITDYLWWEEEALEVLSECVLLPWTDHVKDDRSALLETAKPSLYKAQRDSHSSPMMRLRVTTESLLCAQMVTVCAEILLQSFLYLESYHWLLLNLPHGSDVSNNPVFFFCLYVIILPPCSTVCNNPTPCSTVYNKYLEFLHQRAWHTWFQFFCVYVGPCVCLFFILLLYPGRSILLF